MSFLSNLFGFLKLAMTAFVLWAAKQAGKAEQRAEDTERNLDLQKQYTQNHTDGATPQSTVDELHKGQF